MVNDGFLTTEARLAARNRSRLAWAAALSPAERLDVMWRLINESWMTLERHPDGLDHFRRRNFRMRSLRRDDGSRGNGA